jgi:hypothetical protein
VLAGGLPDYYAVLQVRCIGHQVRLIGRSNALTVSSDKAFTFHIPTCICSHESCRALRAPDVTSSQTRLCTCTRASVH